MNAKATLFGLTIMGASVALILVSCSGSTDSNQTSGGSSAAAAPARAVRRLRAAIAAARARAVLAPAAATRTTMAARAMVGATRRAALLWWQFQLGRCGLRSGRLHVQSRAANGLGLYAWHAAVFGRHGGLLLPKKQVGVHGNRRRRGRRWSRLRSARLSGDPADGRRRLRRHDRRLPLRPEHGLRLLQRQLGCF